MAMISAESGPSWWKPDLIYGFTDARTEANELAGRFQGDVGEILVHEFPDGETLVTAVPSGRIDGGVVALYRSLQNPNAKLTETILAASAIRAQGAKRIVLMAPYMPYMRQDRAFQPGQAVSQVVIAKLLATHFDGIVTVQPHLHRTHAMAEVFGKTPVMVLSGGEAIGRDLIARGLDGAVVVGPDEESGILVQDVIRGRPFSGHVATKTRFGDHDVRISLPALSELSGRVIVIVDDIVSSGATLVTLARALSAAGVSKILAYTVHALFDATAAADMRSAGISDIRSMNSVPHVTNQLSAVDLIARNLGC